MRLAGAGKQDNPQRAAQRAAQSAARGEHPEMLPPQEALFRTAEVVCGLPELEIIEPQQKHVAVLQKILDEEKSASILRRRKDGSRHAAYYTAWIRIALAICLCVGILIVLKRGGGIFPAANRGTDEMATQKILAGIQSGDVVFIAFDYEPGFAAEVEAAASPVIRQLQEREATLVVLSTLPTGTAMAGHYFQREPASEAKNLHHAGYLAGSQIGLASLAQSLPATLRTTSGGKALLNDPVLKNVQKMDDLALMLVLVSDAQTGRYWLEQVAPNLGEAPMVMVSSEQTAPLLRAYQGSYNFSLLVGIKSATALAVDRDANPGTQRLWEARQIAVIIALAGLSLGLLVALLPLKATESDPRKTTP